MRAVRAWLARRRLREGQLIGELLLERRRLYPASEDGAPPPAEDDANPLALALAEAQATADEYETLLGLLEDTRAHGGAQAALIEFHLAITERLATLAAAPAAPDGFAERTLYAGLTEEAAAARAAAPAPTHARPRRMGGPRRRRPRHPPARRARHRRRGGRVAGLGLSSAHEIGGRAGG